MPSFEFVREWFLKAATNAKRQGRKDSAALWEDGLAQLDSMQAQLAAKEAELTQLRGLSNELRQLATDCMQCRHWSFHKAGELTDRVDAFNDEGVTMRTPENKVDAC